MKSLHKISFSLILSFFVLLATVAFPIKNANAETIIDGAILSNMFTEEEINELLAHYPIENEVEILRVKIKIYNNNHELVYSTTVCSKEYDCNERLNLFISQSDFVTEVDNIRIYFLK